LITADWILAMLTGGPVVSQGDDALSSDQSHRWPPFETCQSSCNFLLAT
jgi:hypothetical protein